MTDKTVSAIRVEMVVDGKKREVLYLRRDKIRSLLEGQESTGEFFRAIRDLNEANLPIVQNGEEGT